MYNFLIFFFYYFTILFSTIGFGYFVLNNFGNKILANNLGYSGLTGILFLIIISYISHFFISHNYFFNFLILVGGLFLLMHQILNKKLSIKSLKFPIVVFFVLFIAILMNKTHDDFPYYHFPYTYYLTQSDIYLGIGNFNHGFRTSSSIFYLNSLFYLPLAKYYLFQLGAILIMGYCNLIILQKIFIGFKNKKIDHLFYLSLLSFVFINIFFYRIQEHGTDRSAQILILVFFIELISINSFKKFTNDNLTKTVLILALIVSLKSFYILYVIFLVPLGIYLIINKKNNIKNFIFHNFSLYFFIITIILVSIISFLNSGCIVYPVSFTCFEKLSWSIPIFEVNNMNNWYEQWSKAGAGPNFRVDNPEIYIQNFNWVSNWLENYFFNKVSDFIIGLLFIALIFILIFASKNKNKIENNFHYKYFAILIILFIEWFYNHPALRYGGYSLIVLILFYPLSFYLQFFKNSQKKIKKFTLIILSLTILIFVGRNIDRLNHERMIYSYNPIENIFYEVNEGHFRIQKEFIEKIHMYNNCIKINGKCRDKNIKVDMFLNKYIFLN